jgi:hypothetical protein
MPNERAVEPNKERKKERKEERRKDADSQIYNFDNGWT